MGALVPCDVIAPTAGKPTRSLAEHPIAALARHAPLGSGHKPVIFGAHCAHANELAEQARALGYRVAMVDGETADEARAEAFERFALPASDPAALDLLTNANLLTQGWDCPPADVGILARATTTWSMWMQIAGRFLRPSPATGKTRALLVDLRGSVFLHGLPSGDREFSLEVSETQRAKKDRLPSLTCCRSCGATYKSARVCPRCGAVLPPPRRPRIEREKLGAIAIVTSEMKKRAEYEQLLRLGRARGYKPKWAAHVFHAKHGHWPAWPIGKVA
jgi:superfamily II DNA or RNA helicase